MTFALNMIKSTDTINQPLLPFGSTNLWALLLSKPTGLIYISFSLRLVLIGLLVFHNYRWNKAFVHGENQTDKVPSLQPSLSFDEDVGETLNLTN